MKVGTKSLLFGVHQFLWHPFTVFLAWIKLYGFPSWKEIICIFIHDWGYWGKPNMDGYEGKKHPIPGALLAKKWFGIEYFNLCLRHSRTTCRQLNLEPSKLCWADKLSIQYDPSWFYLLRAILSGEIKEYRKRAAEAGYIPLNISHWEWLKWAKGWMKKQGIEKQMASKLVI